MQNYFFKLQKINIKKNAYKYNIKLYTKKNYTSIQCNLGNVIKNNNITNIFFKKSLLLKWFCLKNNNYSKSLLNKILYIK
jgi:hypothetical protein